MSGLIRRCHDILIQTGCPSVSKILPIKNAYVQRHELGFVLASVEIEADSYCTHGLFATSTAVDLSETSALTRAVFESVERYSLAAIGRQKSRIIDVRLDSSRLLAFRKGYSSGFSYADQLQAINTDKGLMAAIGDVFAPYPLIDGNIGAPSTTNGCGAHTTKWNAKLAAALELFERHCIMNFWFIERASTRSFPLGLADKATCRIMDILAELGYNLHVIEVSTRRDVSVALAFAVHTSQIYPYCICSGSAKLTKREALSSCLREVIQTLVALSLSEMQAKQWLDSGSRLTRLHHNMYYYAFPETGRYIHRVLETISTTTDASCQHTESDGVSFMSSLFGEGADGDTVLVSPPEFSGEVFAYRAINDNMLKLVVGDEFGEDRLLCSNSRFSAPHPFP